MKKQKHNSKHKHTDQTQPSKFLDSDTSQDNNPLTNLRNRNISDCTQATSQKPLQQQSTEEQLSAVKQQIVQKIENRILNSQKRLEEHLHEELELFEKSINETLTEIRTDHYTAPKQKSEEDQSKQMEKVFRYKPSLLSEMFKQSDYKTLYHMIVASMFALMMNLWVQDYVEKGIIFDVDTLIWCFWNPSAVFWVWSFLMTSSYLVVFWVCYCNSHKISLSIAVFIYILHQLVQIVVPCYLSVTIEFGFGSRMIILCEAVRLMMKNYSYARNKLLYGTENTLKHYIPPSFVRKGVTLQNALLPDISIGTLQQEIKRYTYFVLAPTLLYRDQYLRAPHQSKSRIFIEFANFFLCIYYGFILFRTFCKGPILELRDNITLTNFILTIYKLMMPSTFSLILMFFGLLHSWFNGWAELLRFPDRTFYLDWWASSEFGQYYRKWNVVVHEFLYYYVYLDSERLSRGRRGRLFAQIATFGCSAIIHEVILTFSMGFFYPICFIMFTGPGVFLIRQGSAMYKKTWFNIVFWLLMYIGTSLMITLYLTEYYARQRIDDAFMYQHWGLFQHVVPRTLYLIAGTN